MNENMFIKKCLNSDGQQFHQYQQNEQQPLIFMYVVDLEYNTKTRKLEKYESSI